MFFKHCGRNDREASGGFYVFKTGFIDGFSFFKKTLQVSSELMKGLFLNGIFLKGCQPLERLYNGERTCEGWQPFWIFFSLMGHSSCEKTLLVGGELLMKGLVLNGIFLKGCQPLERFYSGE